MSNLTDAELDVLAARAEAATPGPWTPSGIVGRDSVRAPDVHRPDVLMVVATHLGTADAEYIAAADPTTILALVTELREAKAEIAALRELARDATAHTKTGGPCIRTCDYSGSIDLMFDHEWYTGEWVPITSAQAALLCSILGGYHK